MANTTKKCKNCKGYGQLTHKNITSGEIYTVECSVCEGSGIQLRSKQEEDFDDAIEMSGLKKYRDDDNFIEFEEDDYEI